MSGQHTPGPWALIQFGGPQIGNPKTGEAVCTMWGSDWTDPQTGEADPWRANARLIAAAPDLLAALEAAESLFHHTFAMDGTIHKQMRAAIARATGAA